MTYTYHARERLQNRLKCIVSPEDISRAVQEHIIPMGRCYLIVKRIQYTEIMDASVKPDGIARGDLIVAVIDHDRDIQITTIILRKSTSQSSTYKYL